MTAGELSSLHVLAPAPFGGAESVVERLITGLAASGSRTGLALIQNPDAASHRLERIAAGAGVQVFPVRARARRYGQQAAELARILTRFRPSVVHSHVYLADALTWWALRRSGIPHLGTVHGFPQADVRARVYHELDLWVLRRMTAVIAVSASLREYLIRRGCQARRVHIMANPIPTRPFLERDEARRILGLPPERPLVAWIGRLSTEKGPDLFLNAWDQILEPSAMAVVVGDGPLASSLRSRFAALESGGRGRWLGALEDAARYVKAFDLLVVSSRTEGSPMVILEAVAARVPVAAFSVGGIPEILDRQSAQLVSAGDTRALSEAIAMALADPVRSDLRAVLAAERVSGAHDEPKWIEETLALYRGLTAPVSISSQK